MAPLDFSGVTLDGKYLVDRELGRGGMGTVYLATHLGTERPVAVKIISPQFMKRGEFVERFRREARAAGRLRHPNVVDVTDFGFASTSNGEVAYLVMEYLDGCTLGEILDEEKNLPVSWTLDILEQVCSAVGEAHKEGIIHRDLKPDNIWLEPNQRGGYTVKVLDFGIAKLEDHVTSVGNGEIPQEYRRSVHTVADLNNTTFAGDDLEETVADQLVQTRSADAQTVIQSPTTAMKEVVDVPAIDKEAQTAVFDAGDREVLAEVRQSGAASNSVASPNTSVDRSVRSLYDSRSSAELTRVGAVLGTPLYMSPEQCRGEHLDSRSDIYSLGVIAYQMLSGEPPFSGDFKEVMEAHKSAAPKPLVAKGVRKKMSWAIDGALSKDPEQRPQTAEAFASVLRSRSEGLWALLRRAMVIYGEHLPKFTGLAVLFYIPAIILTIVQTLAAFLRLSGTIPESVGRLIEGLAVLAFTLASAFCATLIVGAIVWIVAQYLSVPLRPVRMRPALKEVSLNWKKVSASGAVAAFMPIVLSSIVCLIVFLVVWGLAALALNAAASALDPALIAAMVAIAVGLFSFVTLYTWCMLVTPVAMMEKLGIREGFRRSQELVRRAYTTSLGAAVIMFLVPVLLATSISFFVNVTAKAFDPSMKDDPRIEESAQSDPAQADPKNKGLTISWNGGPPKAREPMDMRTRLKHTVLESLVQLFWLPIQILVLSFSGIIVALLYIKTRLAGGETMDDLVERFEDDGRPRTKWQERVRQRLIQSGRIPSKS